MPDFLRKLFDTSDFPARWNCGNWDSFHGWMHIVSDLLIWAAYFMIPVALVYYWWKKRDEMAFPKLFWLFGAFIFSCGVTHFIEAVIFYHPIYRVSGVMKFITAVISWMTVFAIIRITPTALTLPGRAKLSEKLQQQLDANQEVRERLAASNRELEAYTGRVAHDLRNPLSGLILLVQIELESRREKEGEGSIEQLTAILDSLQNMEESVKELHSLSLAKNTETQMSPTSLNSVLSVVKGRAAQKIEECGAKVVIDELPTLAGNETLLTHLFTNLIENAIKYRSDASLVIHITSRREQSEEIITVSDNGRGIPEEDLPKIFDANFRASNVGKVDGSGIGLSLCRSIMETHGGTIRALPVSGSGAEIEMRFPV